MATYTIVDTGMQPAEVQQLISLDQRQDEIAYLADHPTNITDDMLDVRDNGNNVFGGLYANIDAGVY